MLNGDKEYYKVVIDLLKNIITALFVAELGLIGYFFTNNNEYTILWHRDCVYLSYFCWYYFL